MMLECTLVGGPGSCLSGPIELTVTFQPGCRGSELQEALCSKYGTGTLTINGFPMSDMMPGVPPLTNGAVVVDGAAGMRRPQPDCGMEQKSPGLMLAVHGGPGAGTVVALRRGSYRIGRSGTEVAIADAELSREHACLEVSDSAVIIHDLGSANGTTVNGRPVKRAPVSTGSLIRCGNSTFSIVLAGPAALEPPDAPAPGSTVAEPLLIQRHTDPGNRSALILTAVLPLVIGVALALITGMWMFLAFTAVSAVSVLSPFLSGRRQRRELKAAVAAAAAADEKRRRRTAPSAADLVLSGAAQEPHRSAAPPTLAGIWLRVGLATQPANISLDPADTRFHPPVLAAVPLRLRPGEPVTTVLGPLATSAGLINSIIMQLVGLPMASRTRVLIHGPAGDLPLSARFARHVSLVAEESVCRGLLTGGPGPGFAHGVLIIMGDDQDPGDTSSLASSGARLGWQVIRSTTAIAERCGDGHGSFIDLAGPVAVLTAGTSSTEFTADLVPRPVFDRYLRRMAARPTRPDVEVLQVPDTCSLGDVLPLSDAELSRRWSGAAAGSGLAVPVGVGASGPRFLDLQADGPHLLVAGTTGSGKSELLRSLTAALSLCYSPDRVNFLFVDFKGGSGLGPLRHLPHCVGMLTDLSQHQLDRFLVSLRAEVRRRERLLAEAEAPDLASYRPKADGHHDPLPHLVLMIDEFRMLVEEAPEALSELLKIAVIGRSLGLHLVMATQRPQGALTADIRANVTTSIALRVQSELESADIINSGAAAHISIARPGRAFLARGTEVPEEFQAASLASAVAETISPVVTVQSTVDALTPVHRGAGGTVAPSAAPTPAEAAAPLVRQASALWAAMGAGMIHRPVALPLPELIPFPSAAGPQDSPDAPRSGLRSDERLPEHHIAAAAAGVALGLVDLPAQQLVSTLTWTPTIDGHLALIGTRAGGLDDAARMAVQQLIAGSLEYHLYVLDADGCFSTEATLRCVGAVAGLHELRRGARVLERIATEMAVRLSSPFASEGPPLVLVVSGWGSWVSAFRAGPLMWAEDVLHDIIRDGTKAGICVVITGDRELITSRFFAAISNRAYFPSGASEDSRLSWPSLPAVPAVPGRAVVFGAVVNGSPSVAQFFAPSSPAIREEGNSSVTERPPFRIEPLPTRITVADIRSRLRPSTPGIAGSESVVAAARSRHRRLLVGVGGNEVRPVSVPFPAGGVLAVLGAASSGKTSLLAALPELNPHAGEWLRAERDTDPGAFLSELAAEAEAGVIPPSVLPVDDADLLSQAANRSLMELHELGWSLILTSGYSLNIMQRVPLLMQARNHGAGLLIAPRSVTDGDFFGVRFETESHPPPGRAIVIADGTATPVQLGIPGAPNPTAQGERLPPVRQI